MIGQIPMVRTSSEPVSVQSFIYAERHTERPASMALSWEFISNGRFSSACLPIERGLVLENIHHLPQRHLFLDPKLLFVDRTKTHAQASVQRSPWYSNLKDASIGPHEEWGNCAGYFTISWPIDALSRRNYYGHRVQAHKVPHAQKLHAKLAACVCKSYTLGK